MAICDGHGLPLAVVWPGALGVRRRVILGEFPGDPAQHPDGASPPNHTLDEYLEFAVSTGYAGAWPWSFSGTDAYGRVPAEPLERFAQQHPELVNPRALGTPRGELRHVAPTKP